jgi:hypothetical protein
MRCMKWLRAGLMALPMIASGLGSSAFAFGEAWFTWPDHEGYNLDQIVRIEKAPNPAFGGFFWSHQFYVGSGAQSDVMYMGLQQQQDGTRNIIMSIFYQSTTKVNPGNVTCPLPSEQYIACQATQGAGDGSPGAQIIARYPWVEGHDYRLRVWSAGTGPGWWQFYVMDLTTNQEVHAGGIYSQDFPDGRLNKGNSSVQWTEIYGGQQAYGNCAYSPQRAVWSRPTMDNGSVVPSNVSYNGTTAPFQIFPENGNQHYELLTCPMNGYPVGAYGQTACYYYGELNQSCQAVCTANQTLPTPQCSAAIQYNRGGVGRASATMPYLGTPQQGGAIANCNKLLALFNLPAAVGGTRIDGLGLGCHQFPPNSYWLTTPDTDATSAASNARRVCGCLP